MTHMGTDVNELDPPTRELVDFLVPPPRSRRATVIRWGGYALVPIVFLTLWFTGTIAPGVSGSNGALQYDTDTQVAQLELELHNDRPFAVDIDRFELRGAPGTLRDAPVLHLGGGESATISLTVDDARCAGVVSAAEAPWLAVFATPVVPITQRVEPIELMNWNAYCGT
jgi:hypothetical protein